MDRGGQKVTTIDHRVSLRLSLRPAKNIKHYYEDDNIKTSINQKRKHFVCFIHLIIQFSFNFLFVLQNNRNGNQDA